MLKTVSEGKTLPHSPPSPPAEPTVFRSAHGALMFALNHAQGSLQKSALAQMMGGGSSGRGLGGLDGAGQAGMILLELEQLSPMRRALIIGRFSSPTLPCECRSQCCRGYRESELWRTAVEYLTEYVLTEGLTGTVSHYRLRRAIITRYFGIKANLVEIASVCGVHRNTVSEYNRKVMERFKGIGERKGEEQLAFYEIEGYLKQAGIVD
jgi:hypothetical protein